MDEPDDPLSPEEEPPPDLLALPEFSPPDAGWEIDTPCISFHALMGRMVPSTLKLSGSIIGKEMIVLVDDGSMNNFIQSRLATHLNLTIQPSAHMRVTVSNGDALSCGSECLTVKLKLGAAIFDIDLIFLPIYNADLVLGVQWMRTMGPILFDYEHIWMEFMHQGVHIQLTRVNLIQCDMARSASLTKSGSDAAQFYHLKLEPINFEPTPKVGHDNPSSTSIRSRHYSANSVMFSKPQTDYRRSDPKITKSRCCPERRLLMFGYTDIRISRK